jgi:hypothetical protein
MSRKEMLFLRVWLYFAKFALQTLKRVAKNALFNSLAVCYCCIAFGNVRFLFGKTWKKWGIPRTTEVSGAVFNALLLATYCF